MTRNPTSFLSRRRNKHYFPFVKREENAARCVVEDTDGAMVGEWGL